MKVLLDTQIALWAWADPDRIPDGLRQAIADPGNEVYLSQASVWEIQIKFGLGKLRLPDRPERFVPEATRRSGFNYFSILDEAIFFLDRLPDYHRDPFDRLLVAHSIVGHFHLATVDEQILRYPALVIS